MSKLYNKTSKIARNKQVINKIKTITAINPLRQIIAEKFLEDLTLSQTGATPLSLFSLSQGKLDRAINDLICSGEIIATDAVIQLKPNSVLKPLRKTNTRAKSDLLTAICNILKTEALQLGLSKEANNFITKLLSASEQRK